MAAVQWSGGKMHGASEAKASIMHDDKESRLIHTHRNEDIDIKKTHENWSFRGLCFLEKCKRYDELMKTVKVKRRSTGKNSTVTLQKLVIVIPNEMQQGPKYDRDQVIAWATEVCNILEARYGSLFIDADLHFDEIHKYIDPKKSPDDPERYVWSRPHIHAAIVPAIEEEVDGEPQLLLNAKKFCGRSKITSLNNQIQEMTQQKFGLDFMTGTGKGRHHDAVEDLKSLTAAEMQKESLRLAEERREAEAVKAEAEQARAEAEKAQEEITARVAEAEEKLKNLEEEYGNLTMEHLKMVGFHLPGKRREAERLDAEIAEKKKVSEQLDAGILRKRESDKKQDEERFRSMVNSLKAFGYTFTKKTYSIEELDAIIQNEYKRLSDEIKEKKTQAAEDKSRAEEILAEAEKKEMAMASEYDAKMQDLTKKEEALKADREEYAKKMRYVQFLLDAAGNLRKRVQYAEGNTSVVRIVDGKPEKTVDGTTRVININTAVEEINDEHKALEKTKRELVNKWCTVQSGTQPKR